MKKSTAIILAIMGAITAVMVVLFIRKSAENRDMIQLFEIEKEEMENEYSSFAVQYDELQVQISNDSLVRQLEKEKLRTQQLLEELRQTKASNTAEITRLKKELATVRAVLRTYIVQIDSLNQVNQQLASENVKVREQYHEATRTISVLTEAKEKAEEQVQLASQLDAVVMATPCNKRDREEHKTKNVAKFVINFTIAKNITTKTGEKTVYIQILKPDGEVLLKEDYGSFEYENTSLFYSIRKYIEYNGEQQNVTAYWPVEEFLYPGTYLVFIFVDGVMIGNTEFQLN